MPIDASDLVSEVKLIFRRVHGDMPYTLKFVTEVARRPNCSFDGVCDFGQTPPEISIRDSLNETAMVEALCHELAHLVCGLDSGHSKVWEECRDELSVRFAARYLGRCDG
jgi:hypothetical protein